MTEIRQPKPFQFSVLKLLGFVGVICVVCGVLIPRIRAAREATRRQECKSKIKQIGFALYAYHVHYGCYPAPFSVDPSGKPLHSWRVAVEPWLMESTGFHRAFDFSLPWNNPKNLKASLPHGRYFSCPSAGNPAGSGFTNYVMVVGNQRSARSGQKYSSDNYPNAIIVVEIANSDIHWTEPRDLNFDEMSFTINDKSKPSISSHHVHGAMVLHADGRVRFLDESTDPEELRRLLTENLEDASGLRQEDVPATCDG